MKFWRRMSERGSDLRILGMRSCYIPGIFRIWSIRLMKLCSLGVCFLVIICKKNQPFCPVLWQNRDVIWTWGGCKWKWTFCITSVGHFTPPNVTSTSPLRATDVTAATSHVHGVTCGPFQLKFVPNFGIWHILKVRHTPKLGLILAWWNRPC